MDSKSDIKLTENKETQIKICNSLDSIKSERKTILIKSAKHLLLNEFQNSNKNTKSNNNIKFPSIKKDLFNKIKEKKNITEKNTSPINLYIKNINKNYLNRNSKYINLNSLFLYPKINLVNQNKNKISHSIDISSCRNLFTKSKNKVSKISLKKRDNLYDIKNFMKKKYYEDTKTKMEKVLKDDSFFDRSDKDKLIKINKFNIFWKNVLDYCGGYIFSRKFMEQKKLLQNSRDESKETKNKIKLEKLYTSTLASKLIHYKNFLK